MGESGPSTQQCSRAGCTARAQWNVNWRNPRIHGLERVKVWLACADHVDYLREYLTTRNFPVLVSDLADDVSVVPDGSGA
nr:MULTISPECIES: hypothetical protein [unclassified Salinibacterium]